MNSQNPTYERALRKLAQEAISSLKLLNKPIIQFCGPISTGGFGNTEDNLDCLRSYVVEAKNNSISVFDQLVFESKMDEILKSHKGYDFPLLDYFYKPILESGHISALVFLPMWSTSFGSRWEHEFAIKKSIPVFYVEKMQLSEIKVIIKSLQ